jgi:hypothetical protein
VTRTAASRTCSPASVLARPGRQAKSLRGGQHALEDHGQVIGQTPGSSTSADSAGTPSSRDVTSPPPQCSRIAMCRYVLATCAGLTAMCQSDRCPAWLATMQNAHFCAGRVLVEIQSTGMHNESSLLCVSSSCRGLFKLAGECPGRQRRLCAPLPSKAQLRTVKRSPRLHGPPRCAQLSIVYGVRRRAGNESPTAPNPPWLGKGKPARQPAQGTVGDGLVGATPARSRRAPNICD